MSEATVCDEPFCSDPKWIETSYCYVHRRCLVCGALCNGDLISEADKAKACRPWGTCRPCHGDLPRSQESRLDLAKKVIESQAARKTEDVDAWANKLAADSVACGDSEYGPDYPRAVYEAAHILFAPENVLATLDSLRGEIVKRNDRIEELEAAACGITTLAELAALLREAGIEPYLHKPECLTWVGGSCDEGCAPRVPRSSEVRTPYDVPCPECGAAEKAGCTNELAGSLVPAPAHRRRIMASGVCWELASEGRKAYGDRIALDAGEEHQARPGHGDIVLPFRPTDDAELTCIRCGQGPCAFEIEVRRPGGKSWSGLCAACRSAYVTLRRGPREPQSMGDDRIRREAIESCAKELELAGRESTSNVDAIYARRGAELLRSRWPVPVPVRVAQKQCLLPPPGWACSREPGHEGPCAAWASR